MARLSSSWVSPKEADCYLYCDGSSFSPAAYPKLYAILGNNILPDLRDRFLEGSDVPGMVLEAGLPNITAGWSDRGFDTWGTAWGAGYIGGGLQERTGHNSGSWDNTHSFCLDASRSSTVYGKSNTVQPPAVTVRYYIRAK